MQNQTQRAQDERSDLSTLFDASMNTWATFQERKVTLKLTNDCFLSSTLTLRKLLLDDADADSEC